MCGFFVYIEFNIEVLVVAVVLLVSESLTELIKGVLVVVV